MLYNDSRMSTCPSNFSQRIQVERMSTLFCPGDDRDVTAVPVKLCARVARLMGRSLRDGVLESLAHGN